jgi:hypothetical protein
MTAVFSQYSEKMLRRLWWRFAFLVDVVAEEDESSLSIEAMEETEVSEPREARPELRWAMRSRWNCWWWWFFFAVLPASGLRGTIIGTTPGW